MKIANNTVAHEFNAITSERVPFVMGKIKGNKILLSFFRSGSCALSNHRLSLLKKYTDIFLAKNLQVVCVFESMPKDTFPFTGRPAAPFYVLSDPMALLYDMYGVENDENKIRSMMAAGLLTPAIVSATEAGFEWTTQENSNLFRMPADFLIDEDFIIRKVHYTSAVTDFLPIANILAWLNDEQIVYSKSHMSPKVGIHFTYIQ